MTSSGRSGRSRSSRTSRSAIPAARRARKPARAAKPAPAAKSARAAKGAPTPKPPAPPAPRSPHRESVHQDRLLLAALLDVIEALVVVLDREGRIVCFNRSCEELSGYSFAEVRDRVFWEMLLPHEDVERIRGAFLGIVAGTPYRHGENHWVTRQGERRLIAWSNTALLDEAGAVEHVVATGVDITDQRRAEQELAESEASHRAVLEQASEAIVITDSAFRILEVNSRGCEMFGCPRGEMLGKGASDFMPSTDVASRPPDFDLLKRSGKTLTERTLRRGDGTVFTGECGARFLPDGRIVTIIRDITARVQAEQALREGEAKYRAVLEQASEGVTITDEAYRFLDVNPRGCEIFGYTREQLLRMSVRDLAVPENLTVEPLHSEEMKRSERILTERPIRRSDGSVLTVEISARALPDGRILSIVRDITERRRTEQALRESEARYRALLEQASDGICLLSPDFRYLDVNPRACEMGGYTREEMLGMAVADVLLPEDLAAHPLELEGLGRGDIVLTERPLQRKDGSVFTSEISARRFPDGRMMAIVRDVTERKRAEQRLAESERHLERAQQLAHVGSFEADLVGWTADLSAEMARICGVPAGPCTVTFGQFMDHIPPDEQELVEGRIRRSLEDPAPFTLEHHVLRPDGSLRAVEVACEPVMDASGRVTRLLGSIQDVTERRYLEEQLREAQKLEAIGRLAGGVAHDFNNLLTVILGFGESLLLELPLDDRRRPSAVQIRAAARRAAGLTQQLLAFGRRQRLELQDLDLNAVLVDMRDILQRLVGEHVSLVIAPGARRSQVRADRGQMEQVLLNLALNARDAMPDGGMLRITTRDVEAPERGAGAGGLGLELALSDTGQGMSPEVKAHIFEPFYTTKEIGQGTGLGLASVYGVVTQTGGSITVESAPGQGTTFRIWLPSAEGVALPESSVHAVAAVPGGEETILLVEDEPAVRGLVTEVLRRKGYRVIEASDGHEALDQARRHSGALHLLVADIVMPGMGGRDVARRLAVERPGLRVLLISGYGNEPGGPYGAGPGPEAFLQKPFTPAALAGRVREVLDAPEPPAPGA